MTLAEKLSSKTTEQKINSCNSSIQSCCYIIEQELDKLKQFAIEDEDLTTQYKIIEAQRALEKLSATILNP